MGARTPSESTPASKGSAAARAEGGRCGLGSEHISQRARVGGLWKVQWLQMNTSPPVDALGEAMVGAGDARVAEAEEEEEDEVELFRLSFDLPLLDLEEEEDDDLEEEGGAAEEGEENEAGGLEK